MHAVLIGVDRQRAASAYPFGARKENTSVVEVSSMATKRAPLPEVRPFGSVGTVRMTSGSASASSWTITGPGSLSRGASWSESVPGQEPAPNQGAVPPSTFHAHIAPLEASMVVNTTWTFDASMRTAVGSEGCVPRSSATSQSGAPGVAPLSGSPTRVGSSVASSIDGEHKVRSTVEINVRQERLRDCPVPTL